MICLDDLMLMFNVQYFSAVASFFTAKKRLTSSSKQKRVCIVLLIILKFNLLTQNLRNLRDLLV